MRNVRFSTLCLLSQTESRALKISFRGKRPTIIRAGNGFGKSAVAKSLYDAFGARPHKIDRSWQDAKVATLVEFTIDEVPYSILKAFGAYTLFDNSGEILLSTTHVTAELAPALAELLDFRLVMTDRNEQTIVPPPSYIFAPFYIDQDKGWTETWSSFSDMFLPKTKATLAAFHSGVRSNAYYLAQAARDRLQVELREVEAERRALEQAMEHMKRATGDSAVNFNLQDFEDETRRLLAESENLNRQQSEYRRRLAALSEERYLWQEQQNLIRSTLSEMDESFATALEQPPVVECPTCGHHYENSFLEQFGLIGDADSLRLSLINASTKLHFVSDQISKEAAAVNEIKASLERIDSVLSQRKAELTFRDVVVAEGRNEASRILKERISLVDASIAKITVGIREQEAAMKAASSRKRADEIWAFFSQRLQEFSRQLDVRLESGKRQALSTVPLARGSEGPRGVIAYFYAFLHTVQKFSASAFCPVVIDAPNQQGQDAVHMPQVFDFIVREKPLDAQIIVASEHLYGVAEDAVEIVDVGVKKHQVLDTRQYGAVLTHMRPFMARIG